MTNEELDKLQALAGEATKGEWTYLWRDGRDGNHAIEFVAANVKFCPMVDMPFAADKWDDVCVIEVEKGSIRQARRHKDMHFIAIARTAVPNLIAEVRKLQADMRTNAAMLARQCDMARNLEAENARLRKALETIGAMARTDLK